MDVRTPQAEGKAYYTGASEAVCEDATRLLPRMERHAENMQHVVYRLGKVIDRIHGPMPESLNKTSDGCEPTSNLRWQMDKSEKGMDYLIALITTLEDSL